MTHMTTTRYNAKKELAQALDCLEHAMSCTALDSPAYRVMHRAYQKLRQVTLPLAVELPAARRKPAKPTT